MYALTSIPMELYIHFPVTSKRLPHVGLRVVEIEGQRSKVSAGRVAVVRCLCFDGLGLKG